MRFRGNAILWLFLIIPPLTLSAPVTFEFSGVVTVVSPDLTTIAQVGDSLHGTYLFDSGATDADPADPINGHFFQAISVLDFRVGTYSGGVADATIDILNNRVVPNPAFLIDQYQIIGGTPNAPQLNYNFIGNLVSGIEYSATRFNSLNLLLFDLSGTALSSDSLPLVPPDIDLFADRMLTLFFENFTHQYNGVELISNFPNVAVSLTSLHVVPVPPMALAFCISVFALFRCKR